MKTPPGRIAPGRGPERELEADDVGAVLRRAGRGLGLRFAPLQSEARLDRADRGRGMV